MMSYKSDFVLAILHNGSPVREINNTVRIPFRSEYKIRLKNKNDVRAKARVWVDGRLVSGMGDFILNPGETLDLERFLDESMSRGNRFQFVPLSDGRVNDPTDSFNGEIKVEFYKELTHKINFKIDWNKIQPIGTPWIPDPSGTGNKPDYGQYWTVCFNNNALDGNIAHNYVSQSFFTGSKLSSIAATPAPSNGATVEGSRSNQKFVYGDNFETEVFPTTLTLQIRGIEDDWNSSPKLSLTPGKKVKFCSNCGRKSSRRSDKFCGRCGNKFSISQG